MEKLIHEVMSSLSEDVMKQRLTDYSLGYETRHSSVGYTNGLWPVAGTAVPPSHSSYLAWQPLEICRHSEIWRVLCWLVVVTVLENSWNLGPMISKGPF